jgi:hypothetical protein
MHIIAQAVSHISGVGRLLPTAVAGFDPRSGHVEFMVGKEALGQVLSQYFGFLG